MGALGSGRWIRSGSTKRQAESCLNIDLTLFRRRGLLVPGESRTGSVSWSLGDRVRSSISVTADLTNMDSPFVRLSYTAFDKPFVYAILLASTVPNYGGIRWWFHCPLVIRGIECDRQVRKLYLKGSYFGCRHCHDLTYKSQQEHDARVSKLMKNPERLRGMIESGDFGVSYLALRAATKLLTQ